MTRLQALASHDIGDLLAQERPDGKSVTRSVRYTQFEIDARPANRSALDELPVQSRPNH
jgi:hypothetical protein